MIIPRHPVSSDAIGLADSIQAHSSYGPISEPSLRIHCPSEVRPFHKACIAGPLWDEAVDWLLKGLKHILARSQVSAKLPRNSTDMS